MFDAQPCSTEVFQLSPTDHSSDGSSRRESAIYDSRLRALHISVCAGYEIIAFCPLLPRLLAAMMEEEKDEEERS